MDCQNRGVKTQEHASLLSLLAESARACCDLEHRHMVRWVVRWVVQWVVRWVVRWVVLYGGMCWGLISKLVPATRCDCQLISSGDNRNCQDYDPSQSWYWSPRSGTVRLAAGTSEGYRCYEPGCYQLTSHLPAFDEVPPRRRRHRPPWQTAHSPGIHISPPPPAVDPVRLSYVHAPLTPLPQSHPSPSASPSAQLCLARVASISAYGLDPSSDHTGGTDVYAGPLYNGFDINLTCLPSLASANAVTAVPYHAVLRGLQSRCSVRRADGCTFGAVVSKLGRQLRRRVRLRSAQPQPGRHRQRILGLDFWGAFGRLHPLYPFEPTFVKDNWLGAHRNRQVSKLNQRPRAAPHTSHVGQNKNNPNVLPLFVACAC